VSSNYYMNVLGRLKTVTEEACNRLWAGPGEIIVIGCGRQSVEADDFSRKLYSWHNPPTGISVEDRGEGLWLSRGSEEFQIPLRPDERLHFPVVVASGAPLAFALIYKRHAADARGFDFSRFVRILLPDKEKPLDAAKIEVVLEDREIPSSRWWPFELESVSEDGKRMILNRGDEVATEFGCRVNRRTFRLNLVTKEWERIEP
jgi:hypothetical protein